MCAKSLEHLQAGREKFEAPKPLDPEEQAQNDAKWARIIAEVLDTQVLGAALDLQAPLPMKGTKSELPGRKRQKRDRAKSDQVGGTAMNLCHAKTTLCSASL
jgi:hypothetical protein